MNPKVWSIIDASSLARQRNTAGGGTYASSGHCIWNVRDCDVPGRSAPPQLPRSPGAVPSGSCGPTKRSSSSSSPASSSARAAAPRPASMALRTSSTQPLHVPMKPMSSTVPHACTTCAPHLPPCHSTAAVRTVEGRPWNTPVKSVLLLLDMHQEANGGPGTFLYNESLNPSINSLIDTMAWKTCNQISVEISISLPDWRN